MKLLADLILLFSIYSFLGWVLETVFASANEKRFINRGFLSGFFCPIYGFGSLLIIQTYKWLHSIFSDYSAVLVISLLLSILVVTALEYATGFILEKIFNHKWWDYSDNVVNLKGYVCLKYSLLWGGLAFLLLLEMNPVISRIVFLIPVSTKLFMMRIIIIYFIIDATKSMIDALNLKEVIEESSNLSINAYAEKIIQYKRFFLAFPALFILNANIINHSIRRILNEGIEKAKVEFKKIYQ